MIIIVTSHTHSHLVKHTKLTQRIVIRLCMSWCSSVFPMHWVIRMADSVTCFCSICDKSELFHEASAVGGILCNSICEHASCTAAWFPLKQCHWAMTLKRITVTTCTGTSLCIDCFDHQEKCLYTELPLLKGSSAVRKQWSLHSDNVLSSKMSLHQRSTHIMCPYKKTSLYCLICRSKILAWRLELF